jgi:hypothetical protein
MGGEVPWGELDNGLGGEACGTLEISLGSIWREASHTPRVLGWPYRALVRWQRPPWTSCSLQSQNIYGPIHQLG